MRTTITIDDELLQAVKQRAAESGRTLSEVVQDAIRGEMARTSADRAVGEYQKVITFAGKGVRPGVNLFSTAELLDYMEQR